MVWLYGHHTPRLEPVIFISLAPYQRFSIREKLYSYCKLRTRVQADITSITKDTLQNMVNNKDASLSIVLRQICVDNKNILN